MPRKMLPITKAEYLVTVQGLNVYWETFSGVSEDSQLSRYSDGFRRNLLPLVGPTQLSEATFTRGYDPEQDDDILEFWQTTRGTQRGQTALTVVIQPIQYNPNPVAIGTPVILYNFRATGFSGMDVDKTSQDVSKVELSGVYTHWDKRAIAGGAQIVI